MARIAFHLQLEDGKREEYRETHQRVPEDLEQAYLNSGAGLELYSVFESNGHIFGFMQVEDPDRIQTVMEESEEQLAWNEEMTGIIDESKDWEWLDEVYRMI